MSLSVTSERLGRARAHARDLCALQDITDERCGDCPSWSATPAATAGRPSPTTSRPTGRTWS